jgi:hypothetical protein
VGARRPLFSAQQAAAHANLRQWQDQVTPYRVPGGGWTTATRQARNRAAGSTDPAAAMYPSCLVLFWTEKYIVSTKQRNAKQFSPHPHPEFIIVS